MALVDALLALERAAADVESYLPLDADDALLVELLEPWGPPPRRGKGTTPRGRQLQAESFIEWIRDCGSRWESRPSDPHPTGEAMGEALIRWAQNR